MSLNLYTENGNQGQVATNAGWAEVIDALEVLVKDGDYPALKKFLDQGMTDEVGRMIDDLHLASGHVLPDTVKGTIVNLLRILPRSSEVAIVAP